MASTLMTTDAMSGSLKTMASKLASAISSTSDCRNLSLSPSRSGLRFPAQQVAQAAKVGQGTQGGVDVVEAQPGGDPVGAEGYPNVSIKGLVPPDIKISQSG